MQLSQVRRILLTKAIEERASPSALLSAAKRDEATKQALSHARQHQSAQSKSKGNSQGSRFGQLLQKRADLLLPQALQKSPNLASLLDARHTWWLYAIVCAGAFLTGILLDRITDPHRLNLLSRPLLGIMAWNLLAYALLAIGMLWKIPFAARAQRIAGAASTASGGLFASLSRKLGAGGSASKAERDIKQAFWQDWQPYNQQPRHWQCAMHLGAAAMALGVVASLWLTGLFTEYRVGWESTFLTAAQVQSLLHALTWPAQQLLGMPAWSLEQIQQLQNWPPNTVQHGAQHGAQWVTSYALLLTLVVVVPRLILAALVALRIHHANTRAQIDYQIPYFQNLQKDFGSESMHLLIQPYSLNITPVREQSLLAFARRQYGAAVDCQILPSAAYGQDFTFATTSGGEGETIAVIVFNLAATPEKEAQGEAMQQIATRHPGQKAAWLLCREYAERLGSDADGKARLAERQALWKNFIQAHGMQAFFVED